MSHEKSMTFEMDGLFYNIPSVHPLTGKQMTDDEAWRFFLEHRVSFGIFPTLEEALKSAKERSAKSKGGPRRK